MGTRRARRPWRPHRAYRRQGVYPRAAGGQGGGRSGCPPRTRAHSPCAPALAGVCSPGRARRWRGARGGSTAERLRSQRGGPHAWPTRDAAWRCADGGHNHGGCPAHGLPRLWLACRECEPRQARWPWRLCHPLHIHHARI